MACNDSSQMNTNEETQTSASCYPTGCTPCTEAISFPDTPSDGQRYCVPIGTMGEQKCWVYDKCIPGWRAEGPSASPTRYRGSVNVKTQAPGHEDTDLAVAAGDWYIQNADATSPFNAGWGLGLGSSVEVGDRIAYNGTAWQKLPPPNVPFADEALDGDVPDPDSRQGGIVKNATVNQAIAGTNKCDSITPYTLQKKLDNDLVDFSPTKPQTVTATIVEGGAVSVCVNDNNLTLTCDAEATTSAGKPALGRFTFKWVEIKGGQDVPLLLIRSETVTGADSRQLTIDNYTASPATLVRKFRCDVIFTDLFSEDHPKSTAVTEVRLAQALEISRQPANVDLSGDTTSGTFTVTVQQANSDLNAIVPTYTWMINGIDITGASVPANTGYTFTNFTTNELTVTRADNTAGTYTISCKVMGGNCNPGGLVSSSAMLKGPASSNSDIPKTILEPGAVGTYKIIQRSSGSTYSRPSPAGFSTTISNSNAYQYPGLTNGTWVLMSSVLSGYSKGKGHGPYWDELWLRTA